MSWYHHQREGEKTIFRNEKKLTFDCRGKNKFGWYFGSNAKASWSCANKSWALGPNATDCDWLLRCCCSRCWLLLKSELIYDAGVLASGVPSRPWWCCWVSISAWVSILLLILLTLLWPFISKVWCVLAMFMLDVSTIESAEKRTDITLRLEGLAKDLNIEV